MRVKEIVIDGFKSYAKRTVITGWDPQFNCITGLNGSGKSNILDAICFVLGITSMSSVRAQNQQDLIYKRGQAGVTKASVSIVFDNTDKSKSPMVYREVDTITVTRQVVLGGTSKYLVNGHRAQQIQVQQLFQEVQLNVNNPNFLIMQGQITKVVNMQPTEILSLIEEAAGTGMYEKERLRAVKEIKDRDAPLHETEALLNEEVRPKLELLRAQKRDFLEYQQCAASTESLERIVAGSQYYAQNQKLLTLRQNEQAISLKLEELKADLASEADRVKRLESEMNELKLQNTRTEEANQLDKELQAANEEHTRLVTTLEHKEHQLVDMEAQYRRSSASTAQLQQQLHQHEIKVGTFEDEHAALKSKLEKHHKFTEERRELLSGLQTGISTTGDRETGYAYATKKARDQVAAATDKVIQLETRQKSLEVQMSSGSSDIQSLRTQIDHYQSKLSEIDRHSQEKESAINSLTGQAQETANLKRTQYDLRDNIAKLNRDMERLASQYPNISVPPNMQDSRVRGRLANVFKLRHEHKNKSLALEITAGYEMWSLVVDDEKTGAEVLKRARKRTTVLPLNRMNSYVIDRRRINEVDPNGAWLAMDLLEYDEQVKPAVQYAFGHTVICATDQIAERAAFRFNMYAVTLEGDVFDPRGVISGGSQRKSNNGGSLFTVVDEYNRLIQRRTESESELVQTNNQLARLGNADVRVEQTRNELALLAHEASIARSRLDELKGRVDGLSTYEQDLKKIIDTELPAARIAVTESEQQLQTALKESEAYSKNKDGMLKQLMEGVEAAKKEERRLSQELEARNSQHIANQSELIRLRTEIEHESEDMAAAERDGTIIKQEIKEIRDVTLAQLNAQVAQLKLDLESELSKAANIRDKLKTCEEQVNAGNASMVDMRLEIQQLTHSQSKGMEKLHAAKTTLASIEKRWSWASTAAAELESEGQLATGANLEPIAQKLAHEQRRMKSLGSRVDASVVSMIERLELDEEQLRQRLATIRNDRNKLEETMETLNERRRTTIDSVWRQVSDDFGNIFGDLLPSSSCELVPVNDRPIENGFSIRVRLGATWKHGLTELSGGQRSLVALSLILALLRYHPAPMYILDEVDAALDVHHTRNIGHLIKTRFRNAQFIVVSLKDDMFTNANRIFQTRFVDGTSTVAIMA